MLVDAAELEGVQMRLEVPREQHGLRGHRERHGLTQQDVAAMLAELAWARLRQRVGVTADMVSKWERGIKRPTRLYQHLLAELYGTTRAGLGFRVVATSASFEPTEAGRARYRPEVDSAAQPPWSGVIACLGPAGEVLSAKLEEAWEEEMVRRRELLRLLGLAPAAANEPDPALRRQVSSTIDQVSAEQLDELAVSYQQLYHAATPQALLPPVAAHLSITQDLLRGRVAGSRRTRVLANQAAVALLAGRLSYFDLHDALRARGYYALALESARQAEDPLLGAAILAHQSFIPAGDGSFSAARDYLAGAQSSLPPAAPRLFRGWLAAVNAETAVNAAIERTALAAIEEALRACGDREDTVLPTWFDYFDAARLSGFQGYVLLRLGRPEQARPVLESGLRSLPLTAVKQRTVLMVDLATCHLLSHDVDTACSLAIDAVRYLREAGYATSQERLNAFVRQTRPWQGRPSVRALREEMAAA